LAVSVKEDWIRVLILNNFDRNGWKKGVTVKGELARVHAGPKEEYFSLGPARGLKVSWTASPI
jgi:hypothetical protein